MSIDDELDAVKATAWDAEVKLRRQIKDLESRLDSLSHELEATVEHLELANGTCDHAGNRITELTRERDSLASRLGAILGAAQLAIRDGGNVNAFVTLQAIVHQCGGLVGRCGKCGALIRPDPLTGTICACAVENPVTIATDRTNERQTCNHCGNPVPCACW